MNILPNFLIVGASKTGTSSIYHYLKQHPDIFLSNIQKEGRFFSQMEGNFKGPGDERIDASLTRNLKSYQSLFEGYNNEKSIGDISPDYLYHYKTAIPKIKSILGENVKIIIILRSPVDRAYSAYTHFKRDKREFLDFEEAIQKEDERKQNNWIWAWQYKNSGLYYKQVKAYLDNFKNIRFFLFEDLKNDISGALAEICKFIGVSDEFNFDTSYKYNVSGDPKNPVLYKLETSRGMINFIKKFIPEKLISALKKNLTGEKQMIKSEMKKETRAQLIEFFRDDIIQTQKLIQRDLSNWLK